MGLWEVKNCTTFWARYICRQSLGTPVTPELPGPDPTPSLTGSCPQGWASDPKLRHCYKVGSLSAWGRERVKSKEAAHLDEGVPVRPSHAPHGGPENTSRHSGLQTAFLVKLLSVESETWHVAGAQ